MSQNDLYNMVETLKYRGLVVKVFEGTKVATGNNNGVDEVAVLGFKTASFFIHVSAITTTGSVLVTIQTKNPNPDITVYEDLVAFSAVSAVDASEKKDVTGNLGATLSLKWVFTTTTTITFTVYAVLKIE